MKQLRSCFGTEQYSKTNGICKSCQSQAKCEKESRTNYPPLEISRPKYNLIEDDEMDTEELVYGRDY